MSTHFHRFARGALNSIRSIDLWLLPGCCVLCGSSSESCSICSECKATLPRLGFNHCRRCGAAFDGGPICGICLLQPPPYCYAHSPLVYREAVRFLITEYKFRSNLAAGAVLGRLLADSVTNTGLERDVELVVPIPLHHERLAQRGFDQAVELARLVATNSGVEFGHVVQRTRCTSAQSTIVDARARRTNVRNAFLCTRPHQVRQKRVALVDDVMTTGATAAEASRCLLLSGARSVAVWTCARVP